MLGRAKNQLSVLGASSLCSQSPRHGGARRGLERTGSSTAVPEAAGATEVFEQGRFRERVARRGSLWLLCVGRIGGRSGGVEVWGLWHV